MKISVSKFLFFVLTACILLSCEQERDNVSADFIPGKPRPMQESLALADSMVVYNAQGLAYTTNSLKEIKKFAKAAVLDEEYVEYDRSLRYVSEDEANLSVSLFQKGKLIDYLFYVIIILQENQIYKQFFYFYEICTNPKAKIIHKRPCTKSLSTQFCAYCRKLFEDFIHSFISLLIGKCTLVGAHGDRV